MSDNVLGILVSLSSYALVLFYILVLGRGAISALLHKIRPTQPYNEWPTGTAIILLVGAFGANILWDEPSINEPIADFIGASATTSLFTLITFCVTVTPHVLVGVEFRRRRPKNPVDVGVAVVMVVVSLLSLPALMMILSTGLGLVYWAIQSTQYDVQVDPIPWLFKLGNQYNAADMSGVVAFWFNESFQAMLLGVPEIFGIRLTEVEHNDENFYMSALVLVYRCVLALLSIYMFFGRALEEAIMRVLRAFKIIV